MPFAKPSSSRFADVGDWRARLVGHDADVMQLDAGALDLRWDTMIDDDLVIARLRSNRLLSATWTSAPGWRQFVFSLGPEPQHWAGMEVPSGSLTIYGVDREYRLRMPRWDALGIMVREELLDAWVPALLDAANQPPEHSVARLDRHTFGEAWHFAHDLFEAPLGHADDVIRHRALNLLLRGTGMGYAHTGDTIPRARLALRAIAFMDRHASEKPRVADVARYCGAGSRRAVELALQHYLHLTPTEYLLVRRLHLVRQGLLAGHGKLVDVALECGFDTEHWSRFTAEYRKLFGELPSVTRQRGRQRRAARAIQVLVAAVLASCLSLHHLAAPPTDPHRTPVSVASPRH